MVTSSQFIWHLLSPHFPNGTMPVLNVTTMPGILVIPRKIALHSDIKSKIWSTLENWNLKNQTNQPELKTCLGKGRNDLARRKYPKRNRVLEGGNTRRWGIHFQGRKRRSRRLIDYWKVERTIIWAESRRREQDTLSHGTRVGANVEGTKRIFCHP